MLIPSNPKGYLNRYSYDLISLKQLKKLIFLIQCNNVCVLKLKSGTNNTTESKGTV